MHLQGKFLEDITTMKRSLAAITLFLSLALCAQAQNVTSEDREKALKYLKAPSRP